MTCVHPHGDNIPELGAWVCGRCYSLLESRPTRYEMRAYVPFGTATAAERQEIAWQAEVKTSDDGTTLSQFIRWMAKRFARRSGCTMADGASFAIDELKILDEEFGSSGLDWGRAGAIDLADEAMTYWDDSAPEPNG